MRRTTAVKLCEIVDEKGAVLIRAPPGSGKTSLLQLIVQVNTRNMFEDVYYISLVDLSGSERTFESLWTEWHRGVDLNEIRSPKDSTRPYLILVDEGQAAFNMKLTIWGTLKNIVGGHKKNLRMIVVSAWGSEIVSEDGKMVLTPVSFPKCATVSLWPTDTCAGVSLQLTQDEAMEVWDRWCQMVLGVGDSLMSFDDLRDYIFTLTGRQPGLLLHILDWLRQQGLVNIPAGSRKQKAQTLLLSSEFYDSLSSLRSLLRLSKALRGGDQNAEPMRGLVRLLLQEEPLRRSTLSGLVKDAAEKAVLWGQVMEEHDILKIPSQLQRLFLCRELYCSADASVASIREEGLLSFVRRVIERLEPTRLKFSQSRSVKDSSVYERQYQSEFYRAACTITSKDTPLPPDVGPLYGARGFLDFFLSPLGWGFELLRDGSNLEEHVLRFGPGGAYDKLVKDEVVKEYVILDFRMKPLVQAVQGVCHVVFSNDFKMATLHTFGSGPETLHVGPTIAPRSKRKQGSSTKEDEAD
ncbi:hypothetical protein M758_9G044700 [Ceratodon purpureus]|nr:hypothetical protein M758_9G044700 [Ceratodon purpureus]